MELIRKCLDQFHREDIIDLSSEQSNTPSFISAKTPYNQRSQNRKRNYNQMNDNDNIKNNHKNTNNTNRNPYRFNTNLNTINNSTNQYQTKKVNFHQQTRWKRRQY